MLTSDWSRTSQEMILELTRLREAPDPVRLALLNSVLAAVTHMMDGSGSTHGAQSASSLGVPVDADLATVLVLLREQAICEERATLPSSWRPA